MEKSRFEELLESLNKGEPIVYEPRSRLEEHLVAIINKEGKKGLGEPRSRAEELLQIHAEQMANGGGGSGATVEYIPVPNEGHVDKIYFNTDLTPEEVDQIITDANLDWSYLTMAEDAPDMKVYCVTHVSSYENSDGKYYPLILLIADLAPTLGLSKPAYAIMLQLRTDDYPVYVSNELQGFDGLNAGWYDFSEYNATYPVRNNPMPIDNTVSSDCEGFTSVGAQNEALKELIYIDKIENGGVIAEESGEAIEIATEAEMDAVLVEKNVGKFFVYVGETTDKYTNNMIYVVQDSDSPIIEGPVVIEGGATGTAVPNEGLVEKVYINTSLSPEEVDKIITDANLNWVPDSSGEGNVYYVLSNTYDEPKDGLYGNEIAIMNAKGSSIDEGVIMDKDAYIILVNGYAYISPNLESLFGASGWVSKENQLEINGIVLSNFETTSIGLQNEVLKQIFSITPFDGEPFYKELKGTYEPVTVEVTENGETDLTSYMDEQKMPIKVNVNIEIPESEGSVVVEEASATAMPNEGHVDKIYFNTNLTPEEVDKIITDANLDWYVSAGQGEIYAICLTDTGEGLMIMKVSISDEIKYVIASSTYMAYASVGSRELGLVGFDGWYFKEGAGIPQNGEVALTGNLLATDPEDPNTRIGLQNETLKMLISSTPFSGGGKQPVPNSGYVENIKFNTNLTPEEVDKIITDANLTFDEFQGMPSYFVYVSFDSTYSQSREGVGLIIANPSSLMDLPKPGYLILEYITGAILYISESCNGLENFTGWNNDFFTNVVNGNCLKTNGTAEAIGPEGYYFEGIKFGIQNDKLVDLVHIGTDLFRKELTGTYEAVTVNVTENSEVDLTEYWDNQQMPIKVNVEVEGSGGESTLKKIFDHTRSAAWMFNSNGNLGDFRNYIAYDDTENVESVEYMFGSCEGFTHAPSMNLSKVITAESFFDGSIDLIEVPDIVMPEATNLGWMFYGCESLVRSPSIYAPKAEDVDKMFQKCSNLVTVGTLDLGSPKNMSYMFDGCSSLVTIEGVLDFNNVTSASYIFSGCNNLTTVWMKNLRQTSFNTPPKLSKECYLYAAQECINGGEGTHNVLELPYGGADSILEEMDLVYVRFKDPSVTTIPVGEKGEIEFCESTDDRAMRLIDYLNLKNWHY